jgi:3-phosphoshikimate 1-carboxyvinyltransferase
VTIDASASSQFISALLLAGARYDEGVDVLHDGKPVPSLPHIEMTIACLREHGVEVDDSEPNRWRVHPGPVRAVDTAIEPDLSNAAPFLMLALVSGGLGDRARLAGEHHPARRRAARPARAHGRRRHPGRRRPDGDRGRRDPRDRRRPARRGRADAALAALCALADSPSYLRGIAHIRGHETDRLAALATELKALGSDVTETADGLEIRPAPLHGGRFATYADHRMAHAGVVLGAGVDGVLVEDVATTAKTFPGFADVWAGLFAG